MKLYDMNSDLQAVAAQYAQKDEVLIIAKECNKESYEDLLKTAREHNVEPYPIFLDGYDYDFQILDDVQLPALVLGLKYILSFDEAKQLFNMQPEADVLFYKGIEYNALRKAQQMRNQALTKAQVKLEHEKPFDTADKIKKANLLYLKEDEQLPNPDAELPY